MLELGHASTREQPRLSLQVSSSSMAGPPARGGSRSLVQFLAETTPETWYEEMKQCGLTDHEIK